MHTNTRKPDLNLDHRYLVLKKIADSGISYEAAKEGLKKRAVAIDKLIDTVGTLGVLGYAGLPVAAFGVGSLAGAGIYAATSLETEKSKLQRDRAKNLDREIRKAKRESPYV